MDVFDLYAKLSLDSKDYDRALNDAADHGNEFATKFAMGMKAVGSAIAAVGSVAIDLTKSAVQAYGEYEQMVGGGKLVFGEAFGYIEDRAAEAWKNAGLSQSEYLKQVNGFAVGLKTALNGNEMAAAELADKIVTAEADVVAAMGISQESAQNAFNGIMKGNFTMVDNLMLGIKPTKEGYQEMIDKVNQWNAAQGNATKYQMGNLADMQAALVDYIEMQGLSGYAAQEASETIQGALNMVKSAWDNVLLSIAGGGKTVNQSINDLVEAVEALLKNVMPVIEEAIYGIGDLIHGFVPVIVEILPDLIEELLPELINAAMELIYALLDSLPFIIDTLISLIPDIVKQLMVVVSKLLDYLLNVAAPNLLQLAVQIIQMIATGLASNIPSLINTILKIITTIIDTFIEYYPVFLETGMEVIRSVMQGILDSKDHFLATIIDIIKKMVNLFFDNLPKIFEFGIEVLTTLIDALLDPDTLDKLMGAAIELLDHVLDTLIDSLPKFVEFGVKLAKAIAKGIVKAPFAILGAILRSLGYSGQEIGDQNTDDWIYNWEERDNRDTRASGGSISAGKSYLVGEKGPEVVTPTRSGYVHSADETASMLGNNINIYIQGDVYDDEYSMKSKMRNAMLDVLQEQMAYG